MLIEVCAYGTIFWPTIDHLLNFGDIVPKPKRMPIVVLRTPYTLISKRGLVGIWIQMTGLSSPLVAEKSTIVVSSCHVVCLGNLRCVSLIHSFLKQY